MEVINKIPRLTFELIAVLICLLIVHYFFENSKESNIAYIELIWCWTCENDSILYSNLFIPC